MAQLWVNKETREKFVFVKRSVGPNGFSSIGPDNLPADIGGRAPSNDGDAFIARAIATYDAEPSAVSLRR